MTTTETSFIEATRRSQKAFQQIWTDTMYRFFGLLPVPDGKAPAAADAKVPSAEEVVDHAFDYAEAVLDVQRAYAKSLLAVSKSMASDTASMASDTAARAQGMDSGTTSTEQPTH